MKNANGNVTAAEQQLDEGQIEEALDIAADELGLAAKMVEWKAYGRDYYILLDWVMTFLFSQLGTIRGETRRRTMGGANYYYCCINVTLELRFKKKEIKENIAKKEFAGSRI